MKHIILSTERAQNNENFIEWLKADGQSVVIADEIGPCAHSDDDDIDPEDGHIIGMEPEDHYPYEMEDCACGVCDRLQREYEYCVRYGWVAGMSTDEFKAGLDDMRAKEIEHQKYWITLNDGTDYIRPTLSIGKEHTHFNLIDDDFITYLKIIGINVDVIDGDNVYFTNQLDAGTTKDKSCGDVVYALYFAYSGGEGMT